MIQDSLWYDPEIEPEIDEIQEIELEEPDSIKFQVLQSIKSSEPKFMHLIYI